MSSGVISDSYVPDLVRRSELRSRMEKLRSILPTLPVEVGPNDTGMGRLRGLHTTGSVEPNGGLRAGEYITRL